MILPYQDIITWAESGGITPFNPAFVNPASIDLRWSGRFQVASSDTLSAPDGWSKEIHACRLVIKRGDLYLLDTLETIKMSLRYAGILALKSSLGRDGFEHLHAGFFDPGFEGTATLEVENRHPRSLVIEQGQPVVQLFLMQMASIPDVGYGDVGRYQGQSGPTMRRTDAEKDTILARAKSGLLSDPGDGARL